MGRRIGPAGTPSIDADHRRAAVLVIARPYRSLATVMALTASAPAASSVSPAAHSVAPVVTTSSTSTIQRPSIGSTVLGAHLERVHDVRRPVATVEPVLGGRRAAARQGGQPRHRQRVGGRGRDELGLVVAALAAPRRVDRDRDEQVAAGAGATPACRDRPRRADVASRRSPAYLRAWSARRSVPVNGAHHSSWSSGYGGPSPSPSGVPAGSVERAHRPGSAARRADRRPLRPAARDRPRAARDPAAGRRVPGGAWPWVECGDDRLSGTHRASPPRAPLSATYR